MIRNLLSRKRSDGTADANALFTKKVETRKCRQIAENTSYHANKVYCSLVFSNGSMVVVATVQSMNKQCFALISRVSVVEQERICVPIHQILQWVNFVSKTKDPSELMGGDAMNEK